MNYLYWGKKKLQNNVIDTLDLARDKFPGSPVSLDALCKRYRIDNSKRTQHTALIDCDLLAKVYINLIDQKEPTLDFQSDEAKVNQKNTKSVGYFKKVISPTEEELNFLETGIYETNKERADREEAERLE